MAYEVRSGIALPKILNRGRGAGESIYPLAQMEVGDSFVVQDKSPRTVRSAVAAFQKRFAAKFAVRSLSVDEGGGVGVWRVE